MTTQFLNNRYQILATLGRGGFGETFLAIDTHMPSARKCVIKQLKPLVEDPEIPEWLKERFQREAAILEDLGENSTQIPRLYAYFTEKNNFYLVQEWIEGFTLTQTHQQQGNFSSEAVESILINLLPILGFIHQCRIIHRDIKPDNIILRTNDNKPVLIDFGIIKEAMGTVVNPDGRSAYSVALGTPGYMSSEQAAGRPVYSSDLYSLGLTAIFLLTGKTPQYLESDSRTGEILWRKDAPQVSPQLAQVLDQSIRFHPRDRFASAEEMLVALVSRMPPSRSVPQTYPTSNRTAATVAVGSAMKRSHTYSQATNGVTTDFEEEESQPNPFITWFVLPLIFLIIIVSGLTLGYLLVKRQRMQPPPPTPMESVPTPTPETYSTPTPTPQPVFTPTPTPQPVFTPTPTPTPVPTPTPTPEIVPSPDIPPSPENPEVVPSPVESLPPEATPLPENTPAVVPTPSPSIVIPPPVPTPVPTVNMPPAPPAGEKTVN
ncbi:MAG: protein kinase [Snowella sp.]|nr:protein kinase [Snowella sp.]